MSSFRPENVQFFKPPSLFDWVWFLLCFQLWSIEGIALWFVVNFEPENIKGIAMCSFRPEKVQFR